MDEASTSGLSGKSKRPTNSENYDIDSASGSSKDKTETRGKRLKKDDDKCDILDSDNSDQESQFQNRRPTSGENAYTDNDMDSDEEAIIEVIRRRRRMIGMNPEWKDIDFSSCGQSSSSSKKEPSNKTSKQNGSNIDSDEESLKKSPSHDAKMHKKSKSKKKDVDENETFFRDSSGDDSDTEISSEINAPHSSMDSEKVKKQKMNKKYDPTPITPHPKHTWNATMAVLHRQYGLSSRHSPNVFRYNCYGSLHMAQRLELMYKMKKHEGCVNALHFNARGTMLASGSDDLDIVVWDWTISEPVVEYNSGHRSNVFQAKFMPLSNDCNIVSCARDGQIRIGEISNDGICKGTRKLAQHKGAAHRLAIQNDSPNSFLTCGEDAMVYLVDLREPKAEKIARAKGANDKKVPLYSISINPLKPEEFVVGGRDRFVKIYDTRNSNDYLKSFCPQHLVASDKTNVTSVVYNYNGKEILSSYNDEDIYIFDARSSSNSDHKHRYRGHRNSQTVKGVNYFGAKSEYIISGSDCGYIFFWDKESEHIVKYMYGDEGGVVNCLEPNPNIPVLATSGLDDDIKIWVPSCEDPPDMTGLQNLLIQNMKEQEEERKQSCPDGFMDQTIWFLIQHLHRAYSRRREETGSLERDSDTESLHSNHSNSDSETDRDNPEGISRAIQCNQS